MNGLLFGDSIQNNHSEKIITYQRSVGLYRIATLFGNDHNVEILDFLNFWSKEEIFKYIDLFIEKYQKIDFIGFGITFVPLSSELLKSIIEYVKIKSPTCKVIAGGYGIFQSDFWYSKNGNLIDLYFKGFLEQAYMEIINYIESGKFNPFVIDKLKVNDDYRKVINCNKHYKNFDLTKLCNNYKESDFIQPGETLVIELARGCIFKCPYCSFEFTGKSKNDYIRDKEDIKQELINNYNKWGVQKYIIADDTFNDNPFKVNILYEISQELDFELYIWCFARVDLLHAKPETLEKMVKSGVKGVFFGIETFDIDAAKKIGKGFSGEKLKKYLLEIKEKYPELAITVALIVGLPHESKESILESIKWLLDNNICDSLNLQALFISNENSLVETSEFTKNWEKYGYTKMDVKDILHQNENEDIDPINTKKYYRKIHKDINYYLKHFIPWENKEMNFLEAIDFVSDTMTNVINKEKVNIPTIICFLNSFDSKNLPVSYYSKKKLFFADKKIKNFVEKYKENKFLLLN